MTSTTCIPGKDYIGVGVGALIFDNEGKFFLSLRGPKARNERNKWEIPGGKLEFGETLEQAVIRETKEEFGIEIRVKKLLHVYDHILTVEGQHWVSPTFLCELVSGTPKIMEPEKCAAIGWFSLAETEKLDISEITKNDIEFIKKNSIRSM